MVGIGLIGFVSGDVLDFWGIFLSLSCMCLVPLKSKHAAGTLSIILWLSFGRMVIIRRLFGIEKKKKKKF